MSSIVSPTSPPLLPQSRNIDFTKINNSFAEDSDDGVDGDYVIPESQTSTVAILDQDSSMKGQDMESLSLQAGSGTVSPKSSPDSSGHKKNASFQQIGSQNVNALVPATVATTSSGLPSSSNVSLATPTEPARNRSTGLVRNSAVKVDSKHPLSKGQKTDAPMLNYIFDTFSSANKHHHHDQR